MIILKIILCILMLVINPILVGSLITKFMKEKNILLVFILGYFAQFASFEIIYLPMYFLGCSFKAVVYAWGITSLLLSIISIILNRNELKTLIKNTVSNIKIMPKLALVWCVLVCVQIYFPVRYMQQIDPDDAFYLAITTTTIETNSLFKVDAYTGEGAQEDILRYAMSGLTIYFATISYLTDVHPAILEHTIWPIVAIILEFSLYTLIGNKLLKEDKEKLSYFLIFLATVYIFGWISVYTNFAFFAYRSWQGKNLIANLIIPAVWLLYIMCMENDKKVIYWLSFLMLMISSVFTTEMGVFLIPVEVGILSLIYLVQDRKILNFIKSIACCIPQIMIGLIYLIFK